MFNVEVTTVNPKVRVMYPHAKLITPESWFSEMALLVEDCGRRSHKSERRIKGGSAEDFIKRIAFDLGHESIIEHVSITVLIVGSRSMSHQLVRHRLAAYTQESQRYVDYSKSRFDNVLNVMVPPSVGIIACGEYNFEDVAGILEEPMRVYLGSLIHSYDSYLRLRVLDIPAEDAREVLPNACKTEVATTFNIRQWRHVFNMRCTSHAQWQIRGIMQSILCTFLSYPDLRVFFQDQENLLETID